MSRETVLLVDDHVVLAEGIVRILSERFDVVGTVTDAGTIVETVRRLQPDVILMDISMPGVSGLEALRRVLAARKDQRVLVLTMLRSGMRTPAIERRPRGTRSAVAASAPTAWQPV